MQWYEILIIVFAALFVIGVIIWQIVRRVQGKGGCDCGSCSRCSGCAACEAKKQNASPTKGDADNRHTQSP